MSNNSHVGPLHDCAVERYRFPEPALKTARQPDFVRYSYPIHLILIHQRHHTPQFDTAFEELPLISAHELTQAHGQTLSLRAFDPKLGKFPSFRIGSWETY